VSFSPPLTMVNGKVNFMIKYCWFPGLTQV
jgi:hypothetical protein